MPAFLRQLTWVEFTSDPEQDDTAYQRLKSGIEGKEPGFVSPIVQAASVDLAAQRRIMHLPGRFLGVRRRAALLLLVVFGVVGWLYVAKHRDQRADGYVIAALNAAPDALMDVRKLSEYTRPILPQRLGDGPVGIFNERLLPMQQLHGLCALAALEQVRGG